MRSNIETYTTLFLLLILSFSSANAQNLEEVSVNYTMRDGLPSNQVYHIIQDKYGYMWFATNRGVSRFDGNEFKNFTIGNGLISNTIYKFYQDRFDRVWCISGENMLSYIQDGVFHSYAFNQLLQDSLGPSREIRIYVDSLEDLHVFGKQGYAIVSSQGKLTWVYKKQANSRNWKNFNLSIRVFESEAYSYLSENTTASKLITQFNDGRADTVEVTNNFRAPKYSIYAKGNTYTLDSRYLIVSGSTGYRMTEYDGRLTYVQNTPDGIFLGIYKGGGVWIDDAGDIQKLIFPNISVTSIFYDSNNGVWISTLEGGAYYFPNYGKQLKEASPTECNSIVKVEEQIYCGYRNGVIKTLKDRNLSFVRDLTDITGFNILNGMKYDAASQSLYFLANPFSREINLESIANKVVWKRRLSIHNDTAFAIGYTSILLYYQDKLIASIDSQDFNFVSHVRFNQRDYLTTVQGLYFLKGDKVVRQTDLPILSRPLNDIEVFDRFLVMGTVGFGIVFYDPEADSSFQITSKDGLLDDFVSCIVVYKDELWIGTSNGVSQVMSTDSGYQVTRKYTTLSSVNDILIENDTVWLATDEGMQMVFFDNSIEKEVTTLIDLLYVNGNPFKADHNFQLDYNQNNIRIDFTGIDYNNLGKSNYRYALQTDQSDLIWSYTTLSSIEFSNLVPGLYSLLVATKSTKGRWGSPAKVNFQIKPSFWKTNTFYISLGFLLTIILVTFYRLQSARMKKDTKIAQMQLSALRSQMNPHFIFNAFNSIRGFMVNGRIEQADEFLVKFSRVVREFLNHSSKDTILMADEVKLLKDYLDLEKLRSDDGFDYELSVEDTLQTEIISVPSMVVQPFVENAIIHGVLKLVDSRGKITVEFNLSQDQQYVICIITDNGVGQIEAGDIKAGHALEITNKRLHLIGSSSGFKLEDLGKSNEDLTGTRVELNLKIY